MTARPKKRQQTVIQTEVVSAQHGDGIEQTTESAPIKPQSYALRVDEKKALSNMNDRLANYIEKVRSLEHENSQLRVQIRATETEERRGIEQSTSGFKQKITDLRNKLEVATKARNRAELESKKSEAKSKETQLKLNKAGADLNAVTEERDVLRTQLERAKKQAFDTSNRCAQAEDLAGGMRSDLETALQQNDTLKSQLEDETMLRSELQAKIDELKDDLAAERREIKTQLDEVYHKRTVEMTTMGDQMKTTYNNELQAQLQQLRADSEAHIRQSRQETEANFNNQILKLQNDLDSSREQYHQSRQDAKAKITELTTFKNKYTLLERELNALQNKLKLMEDDLALKDNQIKAKNDRIYELRADITRLNGEYKDLLDIKLQLDEELRTYDILLKGEESRLKLPSANGSTVGSSLNNSAVDRKQTKKRPNPIRYISELFSNTPTSAKRPRVEAEEEIITSTRNDESGVESFRTETVSEGSLAIDEVDSEGEFVRFSNKGKESIALHGHKLVVRDNKREVICKFSSKLVLKPGEEVVIYSADSGQHQELSDRKLALKSEKWPSGDEYRLAEIRDGDEHVVAKSETRKEFTDVKPGWSFLPWN